MANVAMTRVWDAPTRLFHWSVVVLLGISWWTAENHEMEWHQRSGLALCALVVFRLIWGVIGGSTARFAHFLSGPRRVIGYVSGRDSVARIGHNPVGGWSVVALLALLIAQIAAGLFAVDVDGIESGPLSYLVTFEQGRQAAEWHELTFNVLLGLSAVHVLAILFYLVVRKRNLIGPMLTGRSRDAALILAEPLAAAPLWRLAIAVLLSLFAAYAISKGLEL